MSVVILAECSQHLQPGSTALHLSAGTAAAPADGPAASGDALGATEELMGLPTLTKQRD